MATFPVLPGLKWGVHKTPMFSTKVQTPASGAREARVALWSYPIWKIEMAYEFLRDDRSVAANATPTAPQDELKQLLGFFLARRGSWEPFYWLDSTDYLIADSARQTIATGDGSTKDFVVPRAYGGFVEPVGRIATSPAPLLYVNGVLQVSGYTLNTPYDGWVRFTSAPANGHVIAWSGQYLFKVRFEKDETDFSNFMYDLWEAKKIAFRSVRT